MKHVVTPPAPLNLRGEIVGIVSNKNKKRKPRRASGWANLRRVPILDADA